MAESDHLTLQLLKQIDQKLERLLQKLSVRRARTSPMTSRKSSQRAAYAKEIAALTPRTARQTDAVDLLHEDRLR